MPRHTIDGTAVHDSGPVAGSAALPLVLLHGMLMDASVWDPALAHLRAAHGRRVVRPEMPGHGESEAPPDGDHSVHACARDLLRVLDALALGRVALVAHSFGAFVALEAAARDPGRIAHLVLVDPAGDFTTFPAEVRRAQIEPFLARIDGAEWRDAMTTGFAQALEGSRPETRERVMGRVAAAPRALAVSMYHAMFDYDAVRALDAYLAAPHARADAIVTPANAWPFSLHVLRPALRAHVVEGVGHWLQLDRPEEFARVLDDVLR